jgi:hypothetical protein
VAVVPGIRTVVVDYILVVAVNVFYSSVLRTQIDKFLSCYCSLQLVFKFITHFHASYKILQISN